MLSETLLHKLRSKGVWVFEYPAHYLLLKKPEAGGNVVKGMPHSVVTEFTDETLSEFKEYKSDCPKLGLLFEDGKYLLQCVNWTPGPGPGDFELTFETAEAAVTFALSYFFSPNIYIDALNNYFAARS